MFHLLCLYGPIAFWEEAPRLRDHGSIAFGETVGPIVTWGAATLADGRVSLSLRTEYVDSDRRSDSELLGFPEVDSEDRTLALSLGAAYGITDDLMIGARLPHVWRDGIRHGEEDEVHDEGDVSGLGDLFVYGQYRFFHDPDEALHLAAIVGFEAPTGRSGGDVETEHQPGSGSWDPLAGLAVSKGWDAWSLHGSLSYLVATEGARDTDVGDRFHYGAAVVWRAVGYVAPHEHDGECPCGGEPVGLDLMLEFNGEWRDKVRADGDRDDHSGGHALFVSPGLRVTIDQRWSFFVSGGVPAFQDLNGKAHETDFRLVGGVAFTF